MTTAGAPAGALGKATTFLVHLRLPFQLVLAPVFLLGWSLSGAPASTDLVIAFLLLHAALYAGATAYNSFYDNDSGPIGGLRRPPRPGGWERNGGLLLQVVAVAGLGWQDRAVGAAAAVLVAAGIAYSHPSLRWKARPHLSLAVVAVGQGAVPLWMGLQLGSRVIPALDGPGAWAPLLAVAAAAMVLGGVYPLTQVYQISEDRARGDCTFAVQHGPDACFRWARLLLPCG